MTWDELMPTATDWAETFFGIIPLEELHDAYLAAKQNPNRRPEDKQFPLKDTEVLDAYYRKRAGAVSTKSRCQYCDLYEYDKTEYPPCPFHQQHLLTAAEPKGLKL